MKLEILGKNLKVTDDWRARVENKLGKYEKYFNENVVGYVNLSQVKNSQIVEITVPLKNGAHIRVEEESFDMLQSIDKAVDKLDRQVRKHKTAIKKRYQNNESIRFEEIPDDVDPTLEDEQDNHGKIHRTKNFPVKPMDPEEAVMQMKLLGHDFFVFLNALSDEVNVVYARKAGGYGLIEPTID